MANVFDVAEYILAKQGEIPAVKLHKLVYYSQAWSLVWNDAPLFPQQIQAWKNGPVVNDLYRCHRQQFTVTPGQFASMQSATPVTPKQAATIDAVLAFYGDKPTQWLSDLTHMEDPWRIAREGVPDGEASNAEISLASMAEYYGGLVAKK